jgi:predicted RNA-binding protein YlqC (UPF0109 family)
MRDVVVYLARALVDEPDRVTVEELPGAAASPTRSGRPPTTSAS